MDIVIKRERAPLQESDLIQFELDFGVSLPESYRQFLLQHNGGHPQPDAFPIQDNPHDTHGLVHYFLCIQSGDVYHLPDWIKRYRNRIPASFIPIACDPGGNLICLGISGWDAGKVYFWEHEAEAPAGESPGFDNMYFVAGNFLSFLTSLTELE